jgi:hypothetical protein
MQRRGRRVCEYEPTAPQITEPGLARLAVIAVTVENLLRPSPVVLSGQQRIRGSTAGPRGVRTLACVS